MLELWRCKYHYFPAFYLLELRCGEQLRIPAAKQLHAEGRRRVQVFEDASESPQPSN
jgi:hypothetical protein